MAASIDPGLAAILRQYDCDPKSDIWDCRGKWIAYHSTLERIAAKANITFDAPTVVEHDGASGVVAIVVTGRMGARAEWSFGEAAPKNNKNAYPYSMAEKRAKDRVTLKLIGAHGLVYSEEEADDFKGPERAPAAEPASRDPSDADVIANDLQKALEKADSLKAFEGVVGSEEFDAPYQRLPEPQQAKVKATASRVRRSLLKATVPA